MEMRCPLRKTMGIYPTLRALPSKTAPSNWGRRPPVAPTHVRTKLSFSPSFHQTTKAAGCRSIR